MARANKAVLELLIISCWFQIRCNNALDGLEYFAEGAIKSQTDEMLKLHEIPQMDVPLDDIALLEEAGTAAQMRLKTLVSLITAKLQFC